MPKRDGVLFGGTVLGFSARHSLPARLFLRVAKLQGGFDNRDDDVAGLRAILDNSFEEVDIDVSGGSVAYFVACVSRKADLGNSCLRRRAMSNGCKIRRVAAGDAGAG